MRMTDEKVRNEKLYCVGYLPEIEKYAIACVVPGIAWYNRFLLFMVTFINIMQNCNAKIKIWVEIDKNNYYVYL